MYFVVSLCYLSAVFINAAKLKGKTAMSMKLMDVAQLLLVSNQTIKNWVNTFPDHFSDTAKRGTGKRYDNKDIAMLQQISNLKADGLKMSEIGDKLTTVEILEPDTPEQEYTNPDYSQGSELQTADFFDAVNQALDRQEEQHKREVAAKDETIKEIKERVEDLKEENARLRKWRIGKG